MERVERRLTRAVRAERGVAPTPVPLHAAVRRLALHQFGATFWWVDLSREVAVQDFDCLSQAERERAARFVFSEHRRRFQIAHAGLRHVLAMELGTTPARVEYSQGAHGKPALFDAPGCSFNMSHSDEFALIAVAHDLPDGSELGVDLEARREVRNLDELAAANFTAREQAELARAADDARNDLFLSGWTRKEACLKAIGSGLSIAPASFECDLAPVRTLTRLTTAQGLRTVEVESIGVHDHQLAAIAITIPAADG